MSVQSNTYVVIGVLLQGAEYQTLSEAIDDDEDKYEPYIDDTWKGVMHHNGLCVIPIHSKGNFVIGRVLAKTDDQNGNYGFNGFIETNVSEEDKQEIKSLILDQFSISQELKLLIFTNYR